MKEPPFKRIAAFLALVVALDISVCTPARPSYESNYEAGLAAIQREDYSGAAAKFRLGAESGYAPSQCALALLYYEGNGV